MPGHVLEVADGVAVLLAAGQIEPGADVGALAAVASLVELAGSEAAALAEPRRWLRTAGAQLADDWGEVERQARPNA